MKIIFFVMFALNFNLFAGDQHCLTKAPYTNASFLAEITNAATSFSYYGSIEVESLEEIQDISHEIDETKDETKNERYRFTAFHFNTSQRIRIDMSLGPVFEMNQLKKCQFLKGKVLEGPYGEKELQLYDSSTPVH